MLHKWHCVTSSLRNTWWPPSAYRTVSTSEPCHFRSFTIQLHPTYNVSLVILALTACSHPVFTCLLMLFLPWAVPFPFLSTFEISLCFKAQSSITSCRKPELMSTTNTTSLVSSSVLPQSFVYISIPQSQLYFILDSVRPCLFPLIVTQWEGYNFIYPNLQSFHTQQGLKEWITGPSSHHLLSPGACSHWRRQLASYCSLHLLAIPAKLLKLT